MDRETEQRRLKEMERNGMKAGLWKVRWRERDGEGEVERGREREREGERERERERGRRSLIMLIYGYVNAIHSRGIGFSA